MALESYHYAWLSTHPNRDEKWLSAMLADGFHVHHCDGDHSNDTPSNLVLIDGVDHMRLHGMKLEKPRAKNGGRKIGLAGPTPETIKSGSIAYYAKKNTGKTWKAIGGRNAMVAARTFAKATGLQWPIR